jgi:hypothetical protein
MPERSSDSEFEQFLKTFKYGKGGDFSLIRNGASERAFQAQGVPFRAQDLPDDQVPTRIREARERNRRHEEEQEIFQRAKAGEEGLFEPAEEYESSAATKPPEPKKPASEPKPKAQLERFKAVGEMDFDKVARPPGDPFEYAMKDGKIFVRDTRNDDGFRDVTGIQNEAAIRGVIDEFGKMPADKARAAFAGRDVTKSTPAIKEGMDPLGRRLVLEEERILGTKR